MAYNIKSLTGAGASLAYYGGVDSNGYFIGGEGNPIAAPTNGDADGNPGLRMYGLKQFPFRPEAPDIVTITGDDGPISQFQFKPATFPNGEVLLGVLDLTLAAQAQGTKTWDTGEMSFGIIQSDDYSYQDICVFVQWPGKSRDTGKLNTSIWTGFIAPKVNLTPLYSGPNERAAIDWAYSMVANQTDVMPWGEALTDTTHGTTAAAGFWFTSPYPVAPHRFNGDGSTVAFNLDYDPYEDSGNGCMVWVDGTLQTYTTGYTTSSTTLTFEAGSTPAADAKIEVLTLYVP